MGADGAAKFDYRTVYSEADVAELTGWNIYVFRGEVAIGSFPQPLNAGSRSLVWDKVSAESAFAQIVAREPSLEELWKIEEHRDIYETAYDAALPKAIADAKLEAALEVEVLIEEAANELVSEWVEEERAQGETD